MFAKLSVVTKSLIIPLAVTALLGLPVSRTFAAPQEGKSLSPVEPTYSVQWQRVEVPLVPNDNKNGPRLKVELPCKPQVAQIIVDSLGRSEWTGQMLTPVFDYCLTVMNFTVKDETDPRSFTTAMMERWKADKANRFIKGSELVVPLKDMQSSVICTDYLDPLGNRMVTVYGVMKIDNYIATIHLTYHASEKAGLETAVVLLRSIKVVRPAK